MCFATYKTISVLRVPYDVNEQFSYLWQRGWCQVCTPGVVERAVLTNLNCPINVSITQVM